MKLLMERLGFTRAFVRVCYVQGEAQRGGSAALAGGHHAHGRYTGADMIMLGSGGDTSLKEALVHAGVYGHDALKSYSPALLKAWKTVLGQRD
jgi:hypothetical protein